MAEELSPEIKEKLSKACLDQSAAKTAQELVVFVVPKAKSKSRAKSVLNFEYDNIRTYSPKDRQEKRIKDRELYYGKLMPFLYARFFGILGLMRKSLVTVTGFFRPIVYQVSETDMRIVAHKSCGLAAQTFMIAMAE